MENPQWLSPEVLRGKPYTYLADVFAFGVIMWEMLTRRVVFEEIRFHFQLEDEIVKGSRPYLPPTLAVAGTHERKERVVDEYVKIMQVGRGRREGVCSSLFSIAFYSCFGLSDGSPKDCWAQRPTDRPHFKGVLRRIKVCFHTLFLPPL